MCRPCIRTASILLKLLSLSILETLRGTQIALLALMCMVKVLCFLLSPAMTYWIPVVTVTQFRRKETKWPLLVL